jgi:hypothetical protein
MKECHNNLELGVIFDPLECTTANSPAMTIFEVQFVKKNIYRSMAGEQLNIYNRPLAICSSNPITGWYRDGYAKTDEHDRASHTVCATMTANV